LAATVFNQITYITNGKIKPEEIYITNLCNSALPHSPRGKTVYIPEDKAKEGFENIKRIIEENQSIEYLFPMSLQVNYWLQKENIPVENLLVVVDDIALPLGPLG